MPTTVWRWRENLLLFSTFWSFEQAQPYFRANKVAVMSFRSESEMQAAKAAAN
jgi:hypothetical protein